MFIIYISGIDGCGKTTQAKLLVDELRRRGVDVEYSWFRWEPSLKKVFNCIRLLQKKTKRDFTVDANQVDVENTDQKRWLDFKKKLLALSIIRKLWLTYASTDYYLAYRKKFARLTAAVVVIDRYVHDFMIDQAINLDMDPKNYLKFMNNYTLNRFRFPDLNIIIDIPSLEGYRRKKDGTSLNYLEMREPYYYDLQGPDTTHFDGMVSINILSKNISKWVLSQLESTLS